MSPVSNVTELANTVQGSLLSSIISPAFVKGAVGLNSLSTDDLPNKGQGNVKKVVKEGYITVTNPHAESEPLAIGSNGEYTETSVSLTAAKACVVTGISLEQQRFGTLTDDKLKEMATQAVGRAVSNDIIGCAAGFSNGVTATNYATLSDLYSAQFSVFNSNTPDQDIPCHFIGSPRAISKLKSEMATTGATPWVNESMLSILTGLPATGGYVGSVPGLADFYQTTGHATTGGDDQMPFMHPKWALAGMLDALPQFWIVDKASEGFYREISAAFFYDVAEINDGAGVNVRGDS